MSRISANRCTLVIFLMTLTGIASATTDTISLGTNGKLTFSQSYNTGNCPDGGYDWYTYTSFVYVNAAGTSTPLSGGDAYYDAHNCGSYVPNGAEPPGPLVLNGSGYTITFTPGDSGGSAVFATTYTPGILYPKYQIESIIYSTPGNRSSNGFTTSTTDGTTTSIGSSFQTSDSTTFSISGGFLGLGSTLSWTYGNAATTGNSTAVSATITQATGVANATNSTAPNSINHQQDLFILWLNPAIEVTQTGSTSVSYSNGTQLQTAGDPSPGQPEIQDQVEVFAQAMLANSSGVTTVPLQILIPQVVDGQTLPGLANICAHPTYYPNSCTQANQCGCVPSDFTPVLAADPLLNYSSTTSPLNADTSGATACTNPKSTAKCRYVPVMVTNGSGTQITELLSGPDDPGGNIPVNTFVQTDSTQTTQTYSESLATTVGYSWEKSWVVMGNGPSLKSATMFTWTDSESTGKINGTSNSMTVTLSSSTVDCYQEIPIFEDTVFHTFVFQQPVNNSCP